MKRLNELSVAHRTVFLRVDFNVPMNDAGEILEDGRIKAALTTIEYLMQQNARVIIASHLGRPDGKVVESLRMLPVVKRLEELLGTTVHYAMESVGEEVERMKSELQPGELLMLENLRFYEEEEGNDLAFAEQLAQGVDVFVNDAFGALHRKHASVYALPSLIFDKAAGFLLQEEISGLDVVAHRPKQPFVVVIGGIKLSDKVRVIEHLAPHADAILLGGGVANTFFKARGTNIGASRIEDTGGDVKESPVDAAKRIAEHWSVEFSSLGEEVLGKQTERIFLPVDAVIAPSIEAASEARVIDLGVDEIPEGWMILDNGPKTSELYGKILSRAATVFWNGPFGVFETPEFAKSSQAIAKAIAESDAYSVLGGGDTESVVQMCNLAGHFDHVSTGGGASLNYIAGEVLPGLEALES